MFDLNRFEPLYQRRRFSCVDFADYLSEIAVSEAIRGRATEEGERLNRTFLGSPRLPSNLPLEMCPFKKEFFLASSMSCLLKTLNGTVRDRLILKD